MKRMKNHSSLKEIRNPWQLSAMHGSGLATGPERERHCWDRWKNWRVLFELDGSAVLIFFLIWFVEHVYVEQFFVFLEIDQRN